MSEQSQGPGYWQASDGLWYPPESTSASAVPAAPQAHGGYPARLTVSEDNKIANWRALVHTLMVIPQMIVWYLLSIIGMLVGTISWFAILFTGKLPQGLHNYQALNLRYANRVFAFTILLTEEYPPFEFETTAADSSGYPIRSDYDYDSGPRNRVTCFFRYFMVIPHYVVLMFVIMAASVVYFLAWFAVLFTGHMPEGMRNFLIGAGRWSMRVQAYYMLLTDEYPPFSLD